MTVQVWIADKLAHDAIDKINAMDGFEAVVNVGLSPEAQAEIIGNYDAMIIRSATKLNAALIEKADKLKVVVRAGIGVDNIDIPACTAKGITVQNTPFGNTVTTAEHAIALMFSLARHIPQATASMKAGKWEKKKFEGTQIQGKTLGVIGTGNIGGIVCQKAVALGMTVLAADPFLTDERAAELGVQKVELDALLAQSKIITIHTPLIDATRNMMNADAFAKMQDGTLLVCAARGGIVNEDDLATAIESGKIAGAALDVFSVEPPNPDHPLFRSDRVILSPHLGASTKQAQINVGLDAADQIHAFITSGEKINTLN